MHIGSVAIFEGEVPYERFVENVAAKLHLIPRYVQRVVPAPLGLALPAWEEDPHFDIRNHIHHVRIDPPGTEAQLRELAGRLFAPMLDRGRPLWAMYLVSGLEGGRTALISKVHHCLVDGVSGIELLMVVLDVSPNPPPPPPPPREPPQPPGATDPASRLMEALLDSIALRLQRAADLQRDLLDPDAARARLRSVSRALEAALPYFLTPVERAPFNRRFSGGRRLAWSEYPFAEVRAVRRACGGTVNDVVLAVLGGAVDRYLRAHGQRTRGRSLRVLVPVNVRREEERGKLGNRISMLLVEVPLEASSPLARLRLVSERTERLKRARVPEGIEALGEALSAAPAPLQAVLAMLPSPPNTLANMVCTNIPGPLIPLYSLGRRLLAHYPLIPLAWEMGIGCGVTSYDRSLFFTLIADEGAAPDVERLKGFLDESFLELKAAAGVSEAEAPQVAVPSRVRRPRRRAAMPAGAMAADAPRG